MSELMVISSAEERQLALSLGAAPDADSQNGGGIRIPLLKINLDDEDDNGKELPKGQFFLTGQETPVYAKSVKIRPLAEMFQYSEYDPANNKLANRTIIAPSLREELIDEKGGVRCGKPLGKVLKENPELAEKYKNVTCFRLVYCLVTYTGKTADGNEVTVENAPALLRLKGSNFGPFDDEVRKRIPRGQNLWNFWVDVTATRKKNGSVVYYVLGFQPDLGNPVPVDGNTLETIKVIRDLIQRDNTAIRNKHMAALRGRNAAAEAEDVMDFIESHSDELLDADFD